MHIVVVRIQFPSPDVHMLIPQTCEHMYHVTKRNIPDVIKLEILRRDNYLGASSMNTGSLWEEGRWSESEEGMWWWKQSEIEIWRYCPALSKDTRRAHEPRNASGLGGREKSFTASRKERSPASALILPTGEPCQTSDLEYYKILCCSKPLGLWSFIMAANRKPISGGTKNSVLNSNFGKNCSNSIPLSI